MIRYVFLALAVVGGAVPMFYFVRWFREFGFDLGLMVETWNANDAGTGLVWDLTFTAIALTVWVIYEAVTRRQWRGLWAIPASFCIGVSCGLPLYLYLRERRA